MSNGGYWTVMEKITAPETKSFLEQNDFDVSVFREYLSEKFNRALHRPITEPNDFDLEGVQLAICGFKNKASTLYDLRNILHYLIFHHYMVIYHKLMSEPEFRIMRAKILFHSSRDKGGG